MPHELWMLAAMEDHGYTDTKQGEINRIARYLAAQSEEIIGNDEFIRACRACGVDAGSYDREDIDKIQRKLNSL